MTIAIESEIRALNTKYHALDTASTLELIEAAIQTNRIIQHTVINAAKIVFFTAG